MVEATVQSQQFGHLQPDTVAEVELAGDTCADAATEGKWKNYSQPVPIASRSSARKGLFWLTV